MDVIEVYQKVYKVLDEAGLVSGVHNFEEAIKKLYDNYDLNDQKDYEAMLANNAYWHSLFIMDYCSSDRTAIFFVDSLYGSDEVNEFIHELSGIMGQDWAVENVRIVLPDDQTTIIELEDNLGGGKLEASVNKWDSSDVAFQLIKYLNANNTKGTLVTAGEEGQSVYYLPSDVAAKLSALDILDKHSQPFASM